MLKASTRLTLPATSPLVDAIQVASLRDTRRVRLLSIAQARQAPSTARVGPTLARSALAGQLRTSAPTTMALMPSATRRSTFSRNKVQAISAVKTLSAFSISDAPDAVSYTHLTLPTNREV